MSTKASIKSRIRTAERAGFVSYGCALDGVGARDGLRSGRSSHLPSADAWTSCL